MKRSGLLAMAVLLPALAGCISNAAFGVTFTGESNADEKLKGDTLRIVRMLVRGRGCQSIDSVDSKVLFYEPTKGVSGHRWGEESWTAMGCANSFPFKVAFTEDGLGGSFFAVSPM